MTKRTFAAFEISPALKAGLDVVKDREGLPLRFQLKKAVENWLREKGVSIAGPAKGRTRATKKTKR